MTTVRLGDLNVGDQFRRPLCGDNICTVEAHGNQYTFFTRGDQGDSMMLHDAEVLSLPQPPPEWVAEVWVNVNADKTIRANYYDGTADAAAHSDRIGRAPLDMSRWVPCDGCEVLA